MHTTSRATTCMRLQAASCSQDDIRVVEDQLENMNVVDYVDEEKPLPRFPLANVDSIGQFGHQQREARVATIIRGTPASMA